MPWFLSSEASSLTSRRRFFMIIACMQKSTCLVKYRTKMWKLGLLSWVIEKSLVNSFCYCPTTLKLYKKLVLLTKTNFNTSLCQGQTYVEYMYIWRVNIFPWSVILCQLTTLAKNEGVDYDVYWLLGDTLKSLKMSVP